MNVHRNDFVQEDEYWLIRIRGTKTATSERYVPVPEELEIMLKDKVTLPAFTHSVLPQVKKSLLETILKGSGNE